MDSVTPHSTKSLQRRINEAKAVLREHPDKKIAHVADTFQLHHQTLYASIRRDKTRGSGAKRGGQNKILGEHEAEAIHKYVRSLVAYGIQPSQAVVFNAIVALKRAQDPEKKGPTQRWFRTWWKESSLYKITTKPLATVRFTAALEKDIKSWFSDYRQILMTLRIKDRKNLINFDPAGLRVGSMKGDEIVVPTDVSELYSMSPEDGKSLTIFECIDAAGSYPPPPLVVIHGHDITPDSFPEGLPKGTRIIPSENGLTPEKRALEFLKHYIESSDSGPEADWKLMLTNYEGGHYTPEFIALANANHIRPYPLIPHLMHCMQPIDVGVLQPYRYEHDEAIRDALLEFSTEFTLLRFLGDLTKIRDNTFEKSTIRRAFEKSGMWPISAAKCVEQLKILTPNIEETAKEPLSPSGSEAS